MTAQERRDAARLPQRYLVRFDDSGEMRLAFSNDVSKAGMFLKTRNPPPPGTGLRMLVRTLHGMENRSGVVIWTRMNFQRPDDPTACSGAGILFSPPVSMAATDG